MIVYGILAAILIWFSENKFNKVIAIIIVIAMGIVGYNLEHMTKKYVNLANDYKQKYEECGKNEMKRLNKAIQCEAMCNLPTMK